MQLISLNEHSTPLTEEQIDQLNKLVQSLSPDLLHHAKVILLFPAGHPLAAAALRCATGP
jgi:hypothetical protein